MFGNFDTSALMVILTVVTSLLTLILTLWITWAIIRSAVLSALRKHAEEQRQLGRPPISH